MRKKKNKILKKSKIIKAYKIMRRKVQMMNTLNRNTVKDRKNKFK